MLHLSMAHTRILRYGRKEFLTQAQIAANNPTYTLKHPHSSQSQKLNLFKMGWIDTMFQGKARESLRDYCEL